MAEVHLPSPNTHNRWHLPGLASHTSPPLPAPPPAPQSSSCARPRRSLTFEVLGVAPRRPARVSSGQRGDTGEVVTHGIRPQGVRRSRGAGEAEQQRRYGVPVCARAGARAAGGGPWWGCGRGRAGRSSLPCLWALRSSAGPARRGGPLPACHFPRRARPWAGAGGARGSPLPPAGARVLAGGGRRCGSGALPRGHRVRAPGAGAQRLGPPGVSAARRRLGPRPRGRPRLRREWRPPAGGSAWSGAPRSAECAGRCRGGGSPRAATLQPPRGPSRNRRPRPQQSPGFPRSGCYGDSCAGE